MFIGVIRLAAAAVVLMSTTFAASAKLPGQTICYNGICHTVLTLSETRAAVGAAREEIASYYDAPEIDGFNPRRETSSGELFDADRDDMVASPLYPDGTELLLWNPVNRRSAHVRVNNAGPYYTNRTLDCSRALAERLGYIQRGTARLLVMVVGAPTAEDARYEKDREYDPVDGYLGTLDRYDLVGISKNLSMLATAEDPLPFAVAAADRGELPLGLSQLADEPELEIVSALDREGMEQLR